MSSKMKKENRKQQRLQAKIANNEDRNLTSSTSVDSAQQYRSVLYIDVVGLTPPIPNIHSSSIEKHCVTGATDATAPTFSELRSRFGAHFGGTTDRFRRNRDNGYKEVAIDKKITISNRDAMVDDKHKVESTESAGDNSQLSYSISLYRQLYNEKRMCRPLPISPSISSRKVEAMGHQSCSNEISASYTCVADGLSSSSLTSSPISDTEPILTQSCNSSDIISIETDLSTTAIDQQIKKMKDCVSVQDDQIIQAIEALDYCIDHAKCGGEEEMAVHRALLLARERRLALNREISRWKALHMVRRHPLSLSMLIGDGKLSVRSISIQLNKDFCYRQRHPADRCGILALLKCGDRVESTKIISLADEKYCIDQHVLFDDVFNFNHLPVDFNIQIEIFYLVSFVSNYDHRIDYQQKQRPNQHRDRSTMNKAIAMIRSPSKTPKKSLNKWPSELCTSGIATLTRDACNGKKTFFLNDVNFPIEGEIVIDSTCTFPEDRLPPIQVSGFLTLYQLIGGFGSWNRYWTVHDHNEIRFFRYPNDVADGKDPILQISLTKCVNRTIHLADKSICPRPNTFVIEVLLTTVGASSSEKQQMLLTADSKDEATHWISAFNVSLNRLRTSSTFAANNCS